MPESEVDPLEEMDKEQLVEAARLADIPGRSSMSAEELRSALRKPKGSTGTKARKTTPVAYQNT